MIPALFLDRDGVIIENREHYVRRWEDVAFIPGAVEALAKVCSSQVRIVVVTNQSAVGRGIITADQARAINQQVCQVVAQAGGRIDAAYICPHAPTDGCTCRKPQPGMLLTAARDLHIDLSRSIMIGDALEDVLAGQNAGLRQTILVRTGRGQAQLLRPRPPDLQPFQVCDSLMTAVDSIAGIFFS